VVGAAVASGDQRQLRWGWVSGSFELYLSFAEPAVTVSRYLDVTAGSTSDALDDLLWVRLEAETLVE
jgi:hypothetical protein